MNSADWDWDDIEELDVFDAGGGVLRITDPPPLRIAVTGALLFESRNSPYLQQEKDLLHFRTHPSATYRIVARNPDADLLGCELVSWGS